MTRVEHQRKRKPQKRPGRRGKDIVFGLAGLVTMLAIVLGGAFTLGKLSGDEGSVIPPGLIGGDPGPVHVHGLGINPADGSLFIATHTGTWRVPPVEREAERVGESKQDTMAFTVAGPDHFLGSGHPDLNEARRENLPPLLGLIESRDAGRSWEPVSLLGKADFHILRFAGERVYGYDASNDRLLVSSNGGTTWSPADRPGPLVDLAVSPDDPRRLIASTETALYMSGNGGQTWQSMPGQTGLLGWPIAQRLVRVAPNGEVAESRNRGANWARIGNVGGRPAALLTRTASEFYVALHDGTIMKSNDGGRIWSVRSRP